MLEKNKINLYKILYEKNTDYLRNLLPMYRVINSCTNFKVNSFLDYGCGKGNLAEIFKEKKKIKIYKYDPAIKEYANLKNNLKVDLIANCDVMEHIPEDEIDYVIDEISKISKNVFFNIYLKEAKTILPNGENAHCTVKPKIWWKNKILNKFSEANYVYSSYKNSVCIITWKIGFTQKMKNYLIVLQNYSEFILSNFIQIFKK